MNEEREQLDRLIDAGAELNEIEQRIDRARLDDEAKAAVWLRAYSARPGFRRLSGRLATLHPDRQRDRERNGGGARARAHPEHDRGIVAGRAAMEQDDG
jgi:hypothetical protein